MDNILLVIFGFLHNIFPNLLWTIGMALLTVLIPLGIAILGDILNKKRDKKIDFSELDLHTVLDNVVQFRELLLLAGLVFFPSFFWRYSVARIFIFSLWVIGIFGITEIIINIYKWIKGNVFDFRFSYLRKCSSPKDLESVWPSIWRVSYIEGRIDSRSEGIFLDIFLETVEKSLKRDKYLPTVINLLDSFSSCINNRSIEFLLIKNDNFLRIMNWHFKIWQKYKCYKDKKVKGRESFYILFYILLRKLTFIFQKIEERALRENESWFLFKTLKKHINSYRSEKTTKDGKEIYYIEDLFRIFYSVFFKVIGSIEDFSKRYDIWECFPAEWKVTKDNYTKWLESRISWNYFIRWALQRIQQPEKDYDDFLDEVVTNLFPEVEPIIWARILLFRYSSYDPEEGRVKSVIEKKWHFGHVGRGYSGTGISDEDIQDKLNKEIEKQIRATYELAIFLFNKTFTKESLKKYIEELKGLESKYSSDSLEERHRLRLLEIFTDMLEFISSS